MKKGIIAALAVMLIAATGAAWYFIGQPAEKNETGTSQTASNQYIQLNMEAASTSLAALQSKDPSKNRIYNKEADEQNIGANQASEESTGNEVQQDALLQEEQTAAEPLKEEQTNAVPTQEQQKPEESPKQEQTAVDPPKQEQAPIEPPKEEQTHTEPPQEEQKTEEPQQQEQADPWQDLDDVTRARAQFILNNFDSFSGTSITDTDAVYYARIFGLLASQRPNGYIDAETLMGIAFTESRYDTYAVAQDDSGRYLGLMQLHEAYEAYYGYGEGQLFDPYCNIECACRLLDECAAYYGYDLTKTILAYHWGPIPAIAEGTVDEYYTRDYVYPIANQIRSMY